MDISTWKKEDYEKWCGDLNEEQINVFDKFIQRQNIFITGPGGTGKTYLIRRIHNYASYIKRSIQVCATTGCSAILLDCDATTIHSWAYIGYGDSDADYYVQKIRSKPQKLRNWLNIQVLVIDEISMLSKKLFDTLNYIAKSLRKSARPFGGIQIIASGDFYQLPPVGNKEEPETKQFAFESEEWSNVFQNQIELSLNHRQSDKTFLSILNQIRIGKITRSNYEILKDYVNRTVSDEDEIRPASLLPTRIKAEQINTKELNRIENPLVEYHCTEQKTIQLKNIEHGHKLPSPAQIEYELQFILKNSKFEKTLKLKKGAQVMCIMNLSLKEEIVNGSIGIVVDFKKDMESFAYTPHDLSASIDDIEYPLVRFNNGKEVLMKPHLWSSKSQYKDLGIGILQIPLVLAWAVSIHKSQGMTLDKAEIDIGKSIFECGQTYVALSRVRSLDGLYLTSFEPTRIRVNKKVKKFYESI